MSLRAIIIAMLTAIRPRRHIKGWYAGPIIGLKSYSGVRLEPLPGGVLQFDMSQGIDALCKHVSSLPASMTINYELTGDVEPTEATTDPLISVCFQRKWDDWTADGKYEDYRWYAAFAPVLKPGAGEFTVDFTSLEWGGVMGHQAADHVEAFNAAKANVSTIYITFGAAGGRSHGVAGQTRFKLLAAQLSNDKPDGGVR